MWYTIICCTSILLTEDGSNTLFRNIDINLSSCTTSHSRRKNLNELNWLGIVVVTIIETEVMILPKSCGPIIQGSVRKILSFENRVL